MRSWIARRTLRAFAKRYGYDVSYLEMMLNGPPAAFFKFAPLMKAAAHREAVPIDASFAAKIVGALAEDCGPCTQWSSTWRWKRAWRRTRSKPFFVAIRAR